MKRKFVGFAAGLMDSSVPQLNAVIVVNSRQPLQYRFRGHKTKQNQELVL